MNLELFRALTPWISFLLLLGLGTIGWLIRWMLAENLRRFRDFKENLSGPGTGKTGRSKTTF